MFFSSLQRDFVHGLAPEYVTHRLDTGRTGKRLWSSLIREIDIHQHAVKVITWCEMCNSKDSQHMIKLNFKKPGLIAQAMSASECLERIPPAICNRNSGQSLVDYTLPRVNSQRHTELPANQGPAQNYLFSMVITVLVFLKAPLDTILNKCSSGRLTNGCKQALERYTTGTRQIFEQTWTIKASAFFYHFTQLCTGINSFQVQYRTLLYY